MPGSDLATQPTRWGSITDAAIEHGVHTATIRRRIADGTITAYRFGPRLIRLDLDEVSTSLRPIPTAKAS